MSEENRRATEQYLNRVERLLKVVGLKGPPRIVAAECLLIAKAACEMGAIPTDFPHVAHKIAAMIEEARSTPEFKKRQAEQAKQEEAMAQEVHLPECPAYKMWVETSMPAAPGECKCGGSPL